MKRKAPISSQGPGLAFVLLCFFGSGATGLIYQVLWVRMIERVMGAAPFAVAIVLAVFMGGLGLGSFLASRWIDNNAGNPAKLVRAYGLLELGIGAYALAIPLLLAAMHPLYAMLYQALEHQFLLFNIVTCLFAGIALLVPTTLMGATLPVLCRYVVPQIDTLGGRTGLLYGLNTLGAAVGAWLAGLVLLPTYGMSGTLAIAVAGNVVIGLSCLAFAKATKPAAVSKAHKAKRAPEDAPPVEAQPVRFFYILMAVSGFCSLAYEVILTKLLSLVVGPTTYSFTIVLVTFITGLALGSLIFGRLGDKVARPDLLLLWSQLGAAATMLACTQLLGNSQLFFSKLLFTYQDSFAEQQSLKALALFGFMILPTICLGGTFPLAGKLIARAPDRIGRALGVGYAINTAGCVAGSLAAGFLLVPLVGKERGLSLIAAIQILAVTAGAILQARETPRQRLSLAAISAIGLLGCLVVPRWNHLNLSTSKYHRFQSLIPTLLRHGWLESLFRGPTILAELDPRELLYYGEGIGGFTSVVKATDVLGNTELAMANSGKFDASSVGDMKTQVLLAHVPMLLHPDPRRVLVVGLGSGITGGEVLLYPSVTQLDIVEIGSQVVRGSHFFDQFNNRVLESPKVNLIIQDARAHLNLGNESYDVIISEPSNPWMAGMGALFTREFFRLAKNRLHPGGIYVQFIHTYEIDWSSFSLVMRTFADVFPNAALMATHPSQEGADYLLLGFADDYARLNFDVPRAPSAPVEHSQNVRLADPALLDRLIVTEDLRAMAGAGPVNTEDHPLLEFSAPRSLYARDGTIHEWIQQRRRLSPEIAKRVETLKNDPESQIAFADFALSLHIPFQGMEPSLPSKDQETRFRGMIADYSEHFPIECSLFQAPDLVSECFRGQVSALEERVALLDPTGMAYLADLHYRTGRRDEAREGLEAALAKDPNSLLALNDLGIIAGEDGRYLDAISYFERAQRLDPYVPEPYVNLGLSYLKLGQRAAATRHFEAALKLDPSSAIAMQGLRSSTQP